MIVKRRLFLSYMAFGVIIIFLLYQLNSYYNDRFDEIETDSTDFSIGVQPPDPFPQGKPDFRGKRREEQKRQEEEEKRERERKANLKKLAEEEHKKKESAELAVKKKQESESTKEKKKSS
ncbi:uncharacterized protein SAPINGB_P004492 [Magnusiomyces paraingens]|uniref:Uncharacterized protein n=1 Tax=Magnusiomyces paraingens TaxID=2606893 RepID=A0A5E8BZU9_9ASCO|nr:uncharacterized protein SAPINGB_P004492 [Saprochaete ingens]VVT55230.1 unnamed protein product [Saprochaete ingens]